MNIQNEELDQLTRDVCETMLAMELEQDNGSSDEQSLDLNASVKISGEWNALLSVTSSNGAAKAIAATMFDTCEDDLSEEDVFDALAEIANMIGGNIKGIADCDCDLSIPCVGAHDLKFAGNQTPMATSCFGIGGGTMLVNLGTF